MDHGLRGAESDEDARFCRDVLGADVVAAPPGRSEDELRDSTFAGTPDEVASELSKRLAPFHERKELHLIVRMHYPGMELRPASRAMELFAERVLPALREA